MIRKYRNWVSLLLSGFLIVGSVAPLVVYLFFAPVTAKVVEWEGLLWPAANSLSVAIISSLVATGAAFYLLLVQRRIGEAVIFSAIGFFLPGEFVALGMDGLVGGIPSNYGQQFAEYIVLLAALVGYTFPYVTAAIIFSMMASLESDYLAIEEYSTSKRTKLVLLYRQYRSGLVLAFIVGLNVSFSEVPRCRVLGEDLYGMGSSYFGPYIVGGYSGQGVNVYGGMLSLFFSIIILIVVTVISRKVGASQKI